MVYEWLQNITFIWPENFILLALIPMLLWRYIQKGNSTSSTLLVSGIRPETPSTFKVRFRHLPFVFRLIALTCLIIALARPQHQTPKSRSEGDGIDIVLCMDVSGSMGTKDVYPSRFQVAKEVAIEFVKNRPVDRMGLVIFAGESFTKCPITSDKNAVLSQLQSLKIMDGGYLETGTLIGEGLATSVSRISKGSNKSKVVILLTDGKEMAPPTRIMEPAMATEIAKANNVKVYCIALGSTMFAAEQMVKDVMGNVVRNEVDEPLLKSIANSTGGRYYRAGDKATLQSIYSQIDNLEKSKVTIIKYKDTLEMFVVPVLVALFFLMLEVLLSYTVFKKFP
ncbi:MAG TPA: VWA domain-containing protein [Niabella sp.]|nr:VWA domain-containing protein [Niabella sp.]HOZ96276.1 VWA domain-containing protein [Niabella sp.]HQW14650.1 VWA domain-containing protein [Niabella sp.]HQX19789.1 VWA domain-containing protein [Niabella sp.]HQX41111.1 VWA domain-containing protein [Niabella sp.]